MSSTSSITFETEFCAIYQRNNKAKSKVTTSAGGNSPTSTSTMQEEKVGMKNMRCFPCHSPQGHVEHGFCGSTIVFSTKRGGDDGTLRAWAQFELQDAAPRYQVGELVSLAHISTELERSRAARTKPFLPAQSLGSGKFVINQERLGYNYGWVSNVHSCHFKHCIAIYLFKQTGDQNGDVLECLEIAKSTEFTIVCSRSSGRQQQVKTPSPQIAGKPPLAPIAVKKPAAASSSTVVKRTKFMDESMQRTAESLLLLAGGGVGGGFENSSVQVVNSV